MLDKTQWFTEIEKSGVAFSLQIEEKLHEEQTPYQKIEIYKTTHWGNLMVIDGCIMLTSRDNFLYHEMMSHPVLFAHQCPENVVIIGGGDCGTLREVLKHDQVKAVKQIDIDERVTRLSERYFPELCESNADKRAELLFIDGIKWMRDAQPGSVDVIIVDSTDPIGPGEVLFSQDFYKACQATLADDGLLIQQSESPLIHQQIIQNMYKDMLAAGFKKVQTLFFPQPVYPSGWWSATICSKAVYNIDLPKREKSNDSIKTCYYTPEIHQASFAKPKFFSEI